MGVNAQKPESWDILGMIALKWRQLLVALCHPSQDWTGNSLSPLLFPAINYMPFLTFISLGIIPVHVVYCKAHLCKNFQFLDLLSFNTIHLLFNLANCFYRISSNQLRACKLPTLEISRSTILSSQGPSPSLPFSSRAPHREHQFPNLP